MNAVNVMALLVILASAVFAVVSYESQITGSAILDTPQVRFLSPQEYPTFDRIPITYSLNIAAAHDDEYEKARIRQAFTLIETQTNGTVRFKEVTENASIRIEGRRWVHDGSREVITEGIAFPQVDEYNRILGGEIIFYPQDYYYIRGDEVITDPSWKQMSCENFPLTEVHEILHVLGFGHTTNEKSIMAPMKNEIQSCTYTEIDPAIIACLKHLYGSEKSTACQAFDMFPWEGEKKRENLSWDHLPITYTSRECSSRQQTLLNFAETRIEKEVGFDLYMQDDSNPDVIFQCNSSLNSVVLNEETDYWDTGVYFPAAQPFYTEVNGTLSNITIILFADTRNCGGIEMHEFIHAAGIRDHEGYWTQRETDLCTSRVKVLDTTSINALKAHYNL